MPVERTMQSFKLFAGKEACEFRSAVGLDVARQVGSDVTAGDGMVEDLAQGLETVVGATRSGPCCSCRTSDEPSLS